MDRPSVLGSLTRPISRRAVLGGMGVGLAMAALGAPPARAATLSTQQPQATWTWGVPQLVQGGAYLAGRLYQLTVPQAGARRVVGVDGRTGVVAWDRTDTVTTTVVGLVAAGDGVHLLDSDQGGGTSTLTCLDPATGSLRWHTSVPGATRTASFSVLGSVLYVASVDGHLTALDSATGTTLWSSPIGVAPTGTTVQPPLRVGGIVVTCVGQEVYVVPADGSSGYQLYSYAGAPAGPSLVVGDVFYTAVDASAVHPGYIHGDVLAGPDYNPLSPQVPFSVTAGSTTRWSHPTISGGSLLVADDTGRLAAYDLSSGTQQWEASVDSVDFSGAHIVVDDGIAYLVGSEQVYAVDLSSHGTGVVTYSVQESGAQVVGVQSGACYYAQLAPDYFASLGAVTMADVLHGFFAESVLMADDYVAPASGAAGTQPASPTWRSHLQLLDATGTPRSHKAVRVWSDVPATVVSSGTSYQVGPGQPAWVTTDAAGELALTMEASPTASAASGKGLGCAALYVWGSFMAQGEAIVLYPDHDTLTSLSTVRGTHLSAATSYDGAALLPGSYTPTDASQLASAIRGTMGATGTSLTVTQRRHRRRGGLGKPPGRPPRGIRGASPDGGYIAYPGSVTNLVYQPVIGPTGRAYVPGGVPQWTASVSNGKVTFSPGVARRPVRRPPGSVLGDFEDFLRDVVHGVEEVASVVWKATVSAAQEIYTIAGKVYSFVVKTVEQAAAVVAALLKTVVGDLVRVVEALSFVLSWDTIVENHTAIRGAVTDNLTTLATAVAGIAQGSQVQAFFDTTADSVSADFATMGAALSGRTVAGSSGQRTNPSTLYAQGGATSYTPTRWMTEKVRQNVVRASTPAETGLVVADSAFLSTLDDLATTVSQQLATSFPTLPADLRTAVAAFGQLFSDASHAGGILLADLLQVLSDVVTGILRFAGALIGDALAVFATIVDGIVATLTATVQIPVLSELYALVAGGPLSFVDLLCLVVAIPTTLVHDALTVAATAAGHVAGAAASATPTVLELAGVMALGVFAVIDPLNAFASSIGQDFPPGYSWLWCANALAALALTFPAPADRSVGAIVFWAFQVFPVALTFWGIAQTTEVGEVLVFVTALFAQMLYGIAMLGASIGMAVTSPTSWRGADDLVAVQNCLGFVPYIGSPLLVNPGSGATVEVVVTAVFDVAVAGVATAQLFT